MPELCLLMDFALLVKVRVISQIAELLQADQKCMIWALREVGQGPWMCSVHNIVRFV